MTASAHYSKWTIAKSDAITIAAIVASTPTVKTHCLTTANLVGVQAKRAVRVLAPNAIGKIARKSALLGQHELLADRAWGESDRAELACGRRAPQIKALYILEMLGEERLPEVVERCDAVACVAGCREMYQIVTLEKGEDAALDVDRQSQGMRAALLGVLCFLSLG
jgi:hypothetical protein